MFSSKKYSSWDTFLDGPQKQSVFVAPQRDRETKAHNPMFSEVKTKFLNSIIKSLILSQIFIEHQDQLHNLQSRVQNKTVGLLVQKWRLSRQQGIAPSAGPFWARGFAGLHRSHAHPGSWAHGAPGFQCTILGMDVQQWPFSATHFFASPIASPIATKAPMQHQRSC